MGDTPAAGGDEALSPDAIIAIGRDLLSTVAAHGLPLEVRTERLVNMGHAPVVFGLAQHCLRTGEVVLDLYEAGKHVESLPLIRSVYESALTAMWVAQSREAINGFFNEDVRQRRALSETFAKSTSKVFQEGAPHIAGIDLDKLDSVADDQARNFQRLCDALQPGGAHAYALYRALSAHTHPSSLLVDQYAEPDDDNPENASGIFLRREPRPLGHQTWLYLCVASMLWASRAVDVMHRDSPHRSYLRQTAHKLEVVDILQLSEAAKTAEATAEQQRRRASWKGRRPKG